MPDHDAPTFVPEDGNSTTGAAPVSPLVGDAQPLPIIGGYRILRLLGEGGMGAVYEAEQESTHRTVALKVIRAGYASGEMLRRFDNETQALGRLQHPGIAQIYDAGTAETSFGRQPYFAMELVRGQNLLTYCDSHKLSVRQRLELLAKVCDAVQHAHQRGLIHRDLKPANILVDDLGQPRILDFGVARLTDSDAHATRQTDMGQLIGTLAYMSPEQVLGELDEIDTRSDVYALGVILYELLAGKGPYVIGRQIHEAVRAIREEEPTALSSVNRIYRGDIETIVGKALEKDKTRRYASAAELAADIRRHLHDEPIVARPPSATYQLQKFARRNKALVVGVAAVFAVLVLGIVASTWQATQARRAQREAERQSAIAQGVNDFLQNDMLGQASAYNQSKPDPDIKVRTALDRAAQKIGGKFKDHPEVEVAIRDTIGTTYSDLGLPQQEQQQMGQALALSSRALGVQNKKTLQIMADLAQADIALNRFPDAEKLCTEALDGDRRLLGAEDPQTVHAMSLFAEVLDGEGKSAQAQALYGQVLDLDRRQLGPEDRETLSEMLALGNSYITEGKYPQGEALEQQALDIARRIFGPEHPLTIVSAGELALALRREKKFAHAEALDRQVLDIERRTLGPDHPYTVGSMTMLAGDLGEEGKYAEAETLIRQSLDIQRRTLGPESYATLGSMNELARLYREEGKYAQAEAVDRQILGIAQRVMGPEHPRTLMLMSNLGYLYYREGKYTQAEPLLTRTLDLLRKVLGPVHPSTLMAQANLREVYNAEGRSSRSEDLYQHAVALSPNDPGLLGDWAWTLLTVPDTKLRRPKEALEVARKVVRLAPDDVDHLATLGVAELRNGLWDEAITTLNQCVKLDNVVDTSEDFLFLAVARQGRGDKVGAEKDYARGAELASKTAATNPPELKMVWIEAAKSLGKPAPALARTTPAR